MIDNTFKAVLALDAYNRGYHEGIKFHEGAQSINTFVGSVKIIAQSDYLENTAGVSANFYAVAYEHTYQDENNQTVKEVILSYRGTDDIPGDFATGYSAAGAEVARAQTKMAFEFYNSVAAANPGVTISLTGHSMGGGLASLVAAAKGVEATVFDSMAYESAANKLRSDWIMYNNDPEYYDDLVSDPFTGGGFSSIDLLTEVFGPPPSTFTAPSEYSFSNIKSIEMDGQLAALAFAMDDADVSLPMGENVEIGGGPDWLDLHSMSTLAIVSFAGVTTDERNAFGVMWHKSAEYFWPLLYNDNFAQAIGIAPENTNGTDSADEKLRAMIAYSALAYDGSNPQGHLPFGDTAIHALYDDAKDLGIIFNLTTRSEKFAIYANDISKAFVEYAGVLAQNAVLQSSQAVDETAGVLTRITGALSVDFSSTTWAVGSTSAAMKARLDMVTRVLQSEFDSSQRAELEDIYGGTLSAKTERVSFAMLDAGNSDMDLSGLPVSIDKLHFVFGSEGRDVITGTGGDDIIKASAGNDTIYGSGGQDYVVLGSGSDTVSYENMTGYIKIQKSLYDYTTITKQLSSSAETDRIYGTAYAIHGTQTGDNFGRKVDETISYYGLGGNDNMLVDKGYYNGGEGHDHYAWLIDMEAVLSSLGDLPFFSAEIHDDGAGVKDLLSVQSYWGAYNSGFDSYHTGFDYSVSGSIVTLTTVLYSAPGQGYARLGEIGSITFNKSEIEYIRVNSWMMETDGFSGAGSLSTANTVYMDAYNHRIIMSAMFADFLDRGWLDSVPYGDGSVADIGVYDPTGSIFPDNGSGVPDDDDVPIGHHFDNDSGVTLSTNIRVQELMHPAVVTHVAAAPGHATITFRTTAKQLFLDYNGDEVWFTSTGGGGNAGLTIHYGTSSSINISNFEQGLTLTGTGYFNAGALKAYTLSENAQFTAYSYGNFSMRMMGSPYGGDINGIQVTYFLERLNLNDASYDLLNNPVFKGNAANNTVHGTASRDDTVLGMAGNDNLYAYGGDDILDGGEGNDQMYGGEGNDTLTGGGGDDYMAGGAGDDTYIYNPGFGVTTKTQNYNIYEIVGEGMDTIHIGGGLTADDLKMWMDSQGKLTIQVGSNADDTFKVYGYGSGSTHVANLIERITFDDNSFLDWTNGLITTGGGTANAHYYGGTLDDALIGGTGNDQIQGAAGNDTLNGGGGDDYMAGGAGDDTYVFNPGFGVATKTQSYNVYEVANEGTDTIHIGGGLTADDLKMWMDNQGKLTIQVGSNVDDTFIVYGYGSGSTNVANLIERITFDDNSYLDWTNGLITTGGGSANAHYYGGALNDVLIGGTGNDQMQGAAGNDTLNGGGGDDYMTGGAGDDTYVFNPGFGVATKAQSYNVYEIANEGMDTIHIGGGLTADDLKMWMNSSGYLTVQVGNNVDDTFKIFSNGAGNNHVSNLIERITFDDNSYLDWTNGLITTGGGSANAHYYGGALNDVLIGGTGNDQMQGAAGNDTLNGGGGNDMVTGGAGIDTFLFKEATAFTGIVTIGDFSTVDGDIIDVADLLSGYDPLTSSVMDFVLIENSGSASTVKIDRDGSGTLYGFEQVATLQGITGLTDEATLVANGNLLVA